jgi:hypothetical protein
MVPEHPLQKQIADALRLEIAHRPARCLAMVWCGGPSTTPATQALRLALGRGIVAGVPDLFVLHRGIAHMVEIKSEDGQLSDAQRSVAAAVLAAGGHVGVARDAEEALACLDTWGIPRARRLVFGCSMARAPPAKGNRQVNRLASTYSSRLVGSS